MPQVVEEHGDASRPRKCLSAEEEERLVERLYTEAISHRKITLEELDARFYPVAPPKVISEATLQQSVQRQVDNEMARRQKRQEEINAAVAVESFGYKNSKDLAASKKTMTSEEVGSSVQRVYDEEIERRKANMLKSERLYSFHPEDIKCAKMSKDALQASVIRMSKPKKTEYTIAEINKVYEL